jgi:hypothetical protein
MNTVITDLYRILFGRSGTNKGTDIDMAEHGRQGGISTGQPFKFTDSINYAIKITESGSYTCVAYANPGTALTDAKWKVMRLDSTSGLRIEWADGDLNFDNKADDLLNLNYS